MCLVAQLRPLRRSASCNYRVVARVRRRVALPDARLSQPASVPRVTTHTRGLIPRKHVMDPAPCARLLSRIVLSLRLRTCIRSVDEAPRRFRAKWKSARLRLSHYVGFLGRAPLTGLENASPTVSPSSHGQPSQLLRQVFPWTPLNATFDV